MSTDAGLTSAEMLEEDKRLRTVAAARVWC